MEGDAEMTEREIQKRADEALPLFRDPTPERREWLVRRFRDMDARCKRRTFEQWNAEIDEITDVLRGIELGERPRPKDETLRALLRRRTQIQEFLVNGNGPEPEWPWQAPEGAG